MNTDLESALFALRDSEIKAHNTPVFFTDELRIEKVGDDAQLDKVLTWWRTDLWIPPEASTKTSTDSVFSEVLKRSGRMLDLRDFVALDETSNDYAIIVNNKWIFPNHFLLVTRQPRPHAVTAARISAMCALAEHIPSFTLYITSRGMGVAEHFHGHLFKSSYLPPLARADFLKQHTTRIWSHSRLSLSEIRRYPARDRGHNQLVAGWALSGPDDEIAEIAARVAEICTDAVVSEREEGEALLQTDLFWGPPQKISRRPPERTILIIPRRSEGGKFRRKIGTIEFLGLFVFNNRQYFEYSVDQAIADLRNAGLPWEQTERMRITNLAREIHLQ